MTQKNWVFSFKSNNNVITRRKFIFLSICLIWFELFLFAYVPQKKKVQSYVLEIYALNIIHTQAHVLLDTWAYVWMIWW